jgi:hypothetical protein
MFIVDDPERFRSTHRDGVERDSDAVARFALSCVGLRYEPLVSPHGLALAKRIENLYTGYLYS